MGELPGRASALMAAWQGGEIGGGIGSCKNGGIDSEMDELQHKGIDGPGGTL
jgi:hypothetical protein